MIFADVTLRKFWRRPHYGTQFSKLQLTQSFTNQFSTAFEHPDLKKIRLRRAFWKGILQCSTLEYPQLNSVHYTRTQTLTLTLKLTLTLSLAITLQ